MVVRVDRWVAYLGWCNMADKWLVKSGNINDPTAWNGGTLPESTDDCYANGFTGTINVNWTVASIRTTTAPQSVLYGVPVDDTTGTAEVRLSDSGDVDGLTLEQALKVMLAALCGKARKPATNQIVYRAVDDSKDRITAIVSAGTRSSVTLDADG